MRRSNQVKLYWFRVVLVALVIWWFSLQKHLMQMFGRLVVQLINH
ncbi:Uncharacterised protein [Mycobacteroides abscessus subsp. abscessus]|nr:Uncharacterised protein [Mycobacteroides abscessus subsp. abscessus]